MITLKWTQSIDPGFVPEIFQFHEQFAAREEPVLVIFAPPIRHRVTVAVVLFCHLWYMAQS
jgi:hypothetical protein